MSRIVITENQYKRLFLNEQTKNNRLYSVNILPEANAGQIQKFLKSRGFYKGIVDYDFGDATVEAFSKYYGKFTSIKTVKELYSKLKSMGYPVGNTSGFGPKMAEVLSDLIKKKESKSGDKVLQTSEKCVSSCNKMTDEEYDETLSWIWSDEGQKMLNPKSKGLDINKWSTNTNTSQLYDNKNNCMKCHSVYGAGGLSDRMAVGDLSHLPSLVKMQSTPELRKKYKNIIDAYEQAQIVGTPNALDAWLYKYRHEIIDVLSVAALFIPIPGVNVLLSMALEGVNGGMYLEEGDDLSGYLSFGFMFIPGFGPLYRRLTQKSITKVMKIVKYADGGGTRSATEAYEHLVKKSKQLTPDELKLLDATLVSMETTKKTYGNITKNQFKKEVQREFPEWFAGYKTVNLGFGKGSKFLRELLNPTLIEKYIYAGTIATIITLDQTGVITAGADLVVKELISAGLMDVDITKEESTQVGNNIVKELEKHISDYGKSDMGDKAQEDMLLNVDNMVKTTLSVLDTVPQIPARLEVLKLDINKQKEVVNDLQKKGISSDMELRNFKVFKWAELCKGKNKLSVDVEIDEEKESWLNDRALNYRYIKSTKLGSNFEYASDEDGLWYYKKGKEVKWKLVTDCNSLLKIETELEKLNDEDVDTEGEVIDIIKRYY